MMKKPLFCVAVLSGALAVSASPAVAQTKAPAPPQQAAAPQPGPTDFVKAADQIGTAIDRFDIGTVWDNASAVMQTRVPKAQFIASTAQQRAKLGAVQKRDWQSVGRSAVTKPGGSLPLGQYLTVRLNSVGQPGRLDEILSFHLDSDRQWRRAGYALVPPEG